jgi:hypothetical protein
MSMERHTCFMICDDGTVCGEVADYIYESPKPSTEFQWVCGDHADVPPAARPRRGRKPAGTCEYRMGHGILCGLPTNRDFRSGDRGYWFCEEHMKAGTKQVIGRIFKDAPKENP